MEDLFRLLIWEFQILFDIIFNTSLFCGFNRKLQRRWSGSTVRHSKDNWWFPSGTWYQVAGRIRSSLARSMPKCAQLLWMLTSNTIVPARASPTRSTSRMHPHSAETNRVRSRCSRRVLVTRLAQHNHPSPLREICQGCQPMEWQYCRISNYSSSSRCSNWWNLRRAAIARAMQYQLTRIFSLTSSSKKYNCLTIMTPSSSLQVRVKTTRWLSWSIESTKTSIKCSQHLCHQKEQTM